MGNAGKRLAALFGLPEEYGNGGSAVLFEEGVAVTVRPCRSLLSYREDEVGLETNLGVLLIRGTGLTLKSFNGDVMEVRGGVRSIGYKAGREKRGGNGKC